jgi:predicted Zn-dependent protease
MRPTRREVLGGALCGCSVLALAGCASTPPGDRVAPSYKPARSSTEGDLWAAMERTEAELKRSRQLVRDKPLNAYVRDIACRLAEKHCGDLRLYLLRAPVFNAAMAPNGMMTVNTGLMLRTQNEAQLAAVLGHEIGHYLARHSLQRWESAQATMTATGILSLGLGLAGLGAVGSLAQIAGLAGLQAFSREQEHEADEIGFELMAAAGYRPVECARIWEQLIEEEKAGKKESSAGLLFASHPPSDERLATLRSRAEAIGPMQGSPFAERYAERMSGMRAALFEDELRLRQFDRSLVLFGQIAKAHGSEDGELAFWTGEVYRLRDEAGDRPRAREHFMRALARADAPVATHRSLGLLAQREGDRSGATAAFRRYLELAPDAPDREMIRSYLRG